MTPTEIQKKLKDAQTRLKDAETKTATLKGRKAQLLEDLAKHGLNGLEAAQAQLDEMNKELADKEEDCQPPFEFLRVNPTGWLSYRCSVAKKTTELR